MHNESSPLQGELESRGISFHVLPSNNPGERDTTRLIPHKKQIEEIGYRAISEVMGQLPVRNVDIGVFDKPHRVIPEYGIVGRSYGGKPRSLIEIDLDPLSPHFETAIGDNLRRTLRHELHQPGREDRHGEDGERNHPGDTVLPHLQRRDAAVGLPRLRHHLAHGVAKINERRAVEIKQHRDGAQRRSPLPGLGAIHDADREPRLIGRLELLEAAPLAQEP